MWKGKKQRKGLSKRETNVDCKGNVIAFSNWQKLGLRSFRSVGKWKLRVELWIAEAEIKSNWKKTPLAVVIRDGIVLWEEFPASEECHARINSHDAVCLIFWLHQHIKPFFALLSPILPSTLPIFINYTFSIGINFMCHKPTKWCSKSTDGDVGSGWVGEMMLLRLTHT